MVGISGTDGRATPVRDSQRAQPPALDMLFKRERPGKHHLHMSAEQIGDARTGAFIRNVRNLDAATNLKSSPDKCGELPLPPEAKLSEFGFAFARATSSFTDFTGTEGCTTRMLGCDTTSDTGEKSLTVS